MWPEILNFVSELLSPWLGSSLVGPGSQVDEHLISYSQTLASFNCDQEIQFGNECQNPSITAMGLPGEPDAILSLGVSFILKRVCYRWYKFIFKILFFLQPFVADKIHLSIHPEKNIKINKWITGSGWSKLQFSIIQQLLFYVEEICWSTYELIQWRDAKMKWSCNSCYDFEMEKSTKVHKIGLKYVLILFSY